MGTSFSISAGYLPEDGTGDGEYVIKPRFARAARRRQQATFTRKASVPAGPATLDVYIPGSTAALNNGAARTKSFSWIAPAIQVVQIDGVNIFGTTVQRISTGATAAAGLGTPQEFPLLPEVQKFTLSSAAPVDGSILFRYK
jgi:hypothetical protein